MIYQKKSFIIPLSHDEAQQGAFATMIQAAQELDPTVKVVDALLVTSDNPNVQALCTWLMGMQLIPEQTALSAPASALEQDIRILAAARQAAATEDALMMSDNGHKPAGADYVLSLGEITAEPHVEVSGVETIQAAAQEHTAKNECQHCHKTRRLVGRGLCSGCYAKHKGQYPTKYRKNGQPNTAQIDANVEKIVARERSRQAAARM